MKKIIITTSIAFLFVYSQLSAQKKIFGSGKVVKQSISIKDFTKLDLDGIFDVELSQADTASVVVETDDNLLVHIKAINQDSTMLRIFDDEEEHIKKYTKFKVYVKVKNLEKLTANMFGKTVCMIPIKAKDFELINISEGDMSLSLNVENLKADLNASGNLSLSGKTNTADIKCQNTGNINAFNLLIDKAKVATAAFGGVEINVNSELIASITGSGFLHYKGTPTVVKKDMSGIGSFKKINK